MTADEKGTVRARSSKEKDPKRWYRNALGKMRFRVERGRRVKKL